MPWYVFLLIGFALGFAGGWAFFKHRQNLKDEAKALASTARNAEQSVTAPVKAGYDGFKSKL